MKRTYSVVNKKLVPCELCEGKGTRSIEGRQVNCARCSGKGEQIATVGKEVVQPYKKGSWLA